MSMRTSYYMFFVSCAKPLKCPQPHEARRSCHQIKHSGIVKLMGIGASKKPSTGLLHGILKSTGAAYSSLGMIQYRFDSTINITVLFQDSW